MRLTLPRIPAFVRLALTLLIALSAGACAKAVASPTQTPPPTVTAAPTQPPAPTATATPDLGVLLQEGGIPILRAAYDRLLDEYIDALEPQPLLDAAWDGATQKAAAAGATVPARPQFIGDRDADFAAFRAAWLRLIDGLADPQPVRFAALSAMASSLHDCHTFFLNPVASDTILDTRAGKGSVGVGIELAGVPPIVTEVIPGGPADRAGVLLGDRIASVDGVDTSSSGPASAFDLINGNEGTTVHLQLRRAGALIDATMRRERVQPPNVSSRVVAPGIGYVRVRNFVDGGIASSLRDALLALDAQGAQKWIIDLRDNPGGRLDTDAISLFVREGVVVRDRGRDGKIEDRSASGETLPVQRPTVLLTDNRTGSVSEVFAAAMQEYHAAYIIGAKTNGCVGFTDIVPLGDGSSIAVTTHVNLGPVTNAPLNGVGVVPDQAVGRTAADIAAGRDPQLDAAVAHLQAG
ncbi:MAG TPA: S41 family peptidase [Dehalococcoidia bacterium]|nr:S41 family peptidase [Dehalococcoidia bacterium]